MAALARGDVVGSDRAIVEVRELSGLADDPALTLATEAHRAQTARLLHRDGDMRGALVAIERMGGPNVVGAQEARLILPFGLHAQLEDDGALVRAGGDTESGARRLEGAAERMEFRPSLFTATVALGLARVGTEAACRRMRARLVAGDERHIVGGHIAFSYEGPIDRVVALLDARLGDVASAERLLRAALAEMTTCGFAAWVAQIEYDLGCVLARAGRTVEAEGLLDSAARGASEIGMPGLASRAAACRPRRPHAEPARPAPQSTSFEMEREGDVWRVRFGEGVVRVKDSRGMHLLGRLVERPSEDVHVLALGSDDAGKSLAEGAPDPALDSRARAEYRARLADLVEELEHATRM